MDGYPKPKTCQYKGQLYSETRMAVINWLIKELPQVSGKVLNIAAGGWPIPKQLLDFKKVTEYKTFDKKFYGDSKNVVDVYGDVHTDMPKEWTNYWDCVICNQAFQSFHNPFKAIEEMRRVLKPGGAIFTEFIYNYRWFGEGSFPGQKPKKHRVYDYWRFSRDGVELLMRDFKNVRIERSGPDKWSPYVYMVKAFK